jgi:uncharacterized membrane protein
VSSLLPRYLSGGRRAAAVVWLAAGVYALLLSLASLERHHHFGSGYDIAIFDQAVWLFGHLHDPFLTVRGESLLADHFQPGVALFAPVGALSLGPWLLLVLQSVALALVAPLLFTLARRRGAGDVLAAVVAVAWLCSPLTQSVNLFEWHPEAFAPLLLAAGAVALERGRIPLFLVAAALSMSLKEDITLVYVVWGVVLFAQGRRRLGAGLALGSIVWFALAVTVAIHAFGGSLDFYSHRFGGSDSATVATVLRDLVVHPVASLRFVATVTDGKMILALVGSTLGLCLLGPEILLLAVPTVAANLLSRYQAQHTLIYQYHVVPAGVCALAAAYGAARLPRVRFLRFDRRALAGLALAGIAVELAFTPAYGALTRDWSAEPQNRGGQEQARRAALTLIPGGAAVAAEIDAIAHLAERRRVYQLPEPFLYVQGHGETWSRSDLVRRQRAVNWVLLDGTGASSPEQAAQIVQVRAMLPRLGFRVVFERAGVELLRR